MDLFPFPEIRNVQDKLIKVIEATLEHQQNVVVHAPTGLGKTVAALAPALVKAEEEGLTIFFLTSRHTQHKIAIETLQAIKKKHNLSLPIVDLLGKKHMCLQKGIHLLSSGEFSEYCKKVREDSKCSYYLNARKKNGEATMSAQSKVKELTSLSPLLVDDMVTECEELCPYEIAMLLAKKAKVVIADYNYIFNPHIMETFFKKAEKELDRAVIIVDEGHNLPERLRSILTTKLSTWLIDVAKKEANVLGSDDAVAYLNELRSLLEDTLGEKEEMLTSMKFTDKAEMIELFTELGDLTRENKKRSFLGSISSFLEKYTEEEGFVNILRKITTRQGQSVELVHRCLDPSILSQPVFDMSFCSIIMSGTLEPVTMYKEVLGVAGQEVELPSPFPEKNKASFIVPTATTKYSARSTQQFQKIATELGSILNAVPGNTAVYFPSYVVRDSVYPFLETKTSKTLFRETSGMSKEAKEELLEQFKSYKDHGAALLGVASGSFGEGIDLPGDFLKCVVIVGLPLSKPDLETQALIEHYDKKLGKGWEYGYVLPALSKVKQNAGRCIRSETDKGVIVFLDRRYLYDNYRKAIDDNAKVTTNPEKDIVNFFTSETTE